MPFDIGETINAGAKAFLRAPIVNTIAKNPVYTALMITFIIMLIIMVIFRDADTEESLLVMSLRSGFWGFLLTLTIIFLHDTVLWQDIRHTEQSAAIDNVFNGGYNGKLADETSGESIVPVIINTNFGNI